MSIQNHSRAERKVQIKMTIVQSMIRGQGDELTAYRIARAIGMKPSWHVTQLCAELCAEGKLKCRVDPGKSNRWKTYWYSLADGATIELREKKRSVVIKSNGKQVGQMELF